MDLELDKYVFFQDEAVVLRCIKNDQVELLEKYLTEHGHALDDQVVDRMFNFAVSLIKPQCFKKLVDFFPDRIPTDVLKKTFHAVLCAKQDMQDDLSDDITRIGEMVLFLSERDALVEDDKDDALEIVEEYKLEELLGRIVKLF